MSELCRIIIPWDVNRTSPNRRLHWARRNVLNQSAKLLAFNQWVQAGRPTARDTVRVSVIVRRYRRLDNDNALAGCKPVFDGLFRDAITPDDGPEWVTLGTVTQETGARWLGAEEVEVIVEPAQPIDPRD